MPESVIQFRDAQTLRYRTTAQKDVARDTVRVSVTVNALVSSADRDHAALIRRIGDTLARFIPSEWVLTAPRRQADTSGFERVTLEGTTRAPLPENYNLTERARLAGQEGLSLTDPVVNHRLPAARVAEAVQGLRLAILREVTAQAAQFSQESGLTWQIADIEYGVNSLQPEYRNAKGAYREERDDLSEGDAPEQAAERIRLVASIVLRSAAAN